MTSPPAVPAVQAFIGIGSNLAQPERQVATAIELLRGLPGSRLSRTSDFYRSPPMGPQDQPSYINAVAQLATALSPRELLFHLQAIERAHGRDRSGGVRWGPRTLDLDILVYGDQQIHEEHLTIPHPGIADRPFVLYPLAEIAPALQIPGLPALSELLATCAADGLERFANGGSTQV